MLTLQQLARGFEKVLFRLPGPIRKPVEREWRPLQELFLQHRPARVLIIGEPGAGVEFWARTVFQMEPGAIEAGSAPWRAYQHQGALIFALAESQEAAKTALESGPADVFLYMTASELPGYAELRGETPAVLGGAAREVLLAEIAVQLPMEARLEFARASGDAAAQREIAAHLTRSAAAVCTAIGAQPIPLADFPILTSLQVLMVAGIIHTTGREWSLKLARDFLAALGANVGLALILREGVRAATKFLPGWGNAISGAMAGAGTYAIGRAATAFFIEGVSIGEARRRFKFLKGRKPRGLK
ncbi:MAG: hypothetical protein ACFUZC_22095 [Chthoniobacteraceae bacterium]